METASTIEPAELPLDAPAPPAAKARPSFDWAALVRAPWFLPALLLVGATGLLFWDLLDGLKKLWDSEDGYYSHGYLVPLFAGWIVYRKWPQIRTIPVRGSWLALAPIAVLAYLTYVTTWFDIQAMLAVSFLLFLLAGIWFVAGFRWMLALAIPTLFLGFALPLFTGAIDLYTNPMQLISTKVAFKMLQLIGLDPLRSTADPTTIYLDNFTMGVAVPCSGLKLILALSAFTVFFMSIANLRWWGNLAMAALVLPLCVFINGLRITLIGIVGNEYGTEAGMTFHDYSGYITLLVCFFILFKAARALGWKD